MFVTGTGAVLHGPAADRMRQQQAHRSRTKRVLAVVTVVVVAAVLLNPDEASFQRFLKQRADASAMGSVLHATVTQPSRALGRLGGHHYEHWLLWSRAQSLGTRYVGCLGIWFEQPTVSLGGGGGGGRPSLPKRRRRGGRWWIDDFLEGVGLGGVDDTTLFVGLNLVVFLAWHTLPSRAMADHWTVSRRNLQAGRLHTLLTAGVSHNDLPHVVTNMLTWTALAPTALAMLGRDLFWRLVFTGQLAGCAATLLIHDGAHESLGASGALYAVFGFLASRVGSDARLLFYGVELTFRQALLANLALDLTSRGSIDLAMHVGGAVAGAAQAGA